MASKTLPASDQISAKVNGAGAAAYSTGVKTKWHAEEQNALYGRLVGATYSIDAFDLWLGGQQVISGTTVTAENPQGGPDLYGRQFFFSGATGAKPWADGAIQGLGWYGGKYAFRAGRATGTEWDDASIGTYSVAIGDACTASGETSVSIGYNNAAADQTSIAIGISNSISGGVGGVAVGSTNVLTSAVAAYAFGQGSNISAPSDPGFAFGSYCTVTHRGAFIFGGNADGLGNLSSLENYGISLGSRSTVPTLHISPGSGSAGTTVGRVAIALGATLPTARLDVLGSSASYASLRIRTRTAQPSAPNAGDVDFDGTDLFIYAGGSWEQLTNQVTASLAFSAITAGTNAAALVVGTGGSLTVSGSGTINATTLLGSTWAAPAAIGTGTPAAATFTDATLGSANTLTWTSRTKVTAPSDGVLYITKNDGTSTSVGIGFGDDAGDARIYQNGTASIAVTRNDAGGFASIYAGEMRASGMLLTTVAGSYFGDANRALFSATASGVVKLFDSGGTAPAAFCANALVSAKTTAYPVVAADTGTVFTDEGAGGAFAFTLPTAVVGYRYTFIRTTANTITVTAAAADTIQVEGTTTAAAGSITLDTDGASVTLVAINATEWITVAKTGTVTA